MAAFPALFGLLLAGFVTGQTVEITPQRAVRRIGDEVTVLCRVSYAIDSCRISVGKSGYIMKPNNNEGDVVYTGKGLQHGECGAHIRNIKEEMNGNVTCFLPPQSGNIEVQAAMRLIVARPPGAPQLLVPEQGLYKEGDHFNAQCVVPQGRPVAKITWFLDEEQLLTGVHEPIITTTPDSDLQTISQNISRVLSADDAGRRLACRAEHEALDQPREASKQIIVQYPPKSLESGTITIFGLKLGSEGRLNVTVRANPSPRAEWRLAQYTLIAPQRTTEGDITALEPLHLGGGYYNVTLVLSHVQKEDVERSYHLQVSNELGAEQLTVRISTMDEPAGVELDTGAIVGIVIGVLVLLIAIFLIVFAKATDRWCFAAGRGRDHAKSSGESTPAGDVLIESGIPLPTRTSDTESAVGGRERSRLQALGAFGARMRAALPMHKDKVQATEATPEKAVAEEKKGVVYAELALGEQTTDKPAPPSTEYAEIVYTDQGKEAKEPKE